MVSFCRKYFLLKVRQNWFSGECKISDLFSLNAFLFVKEIRQKRSWGIIKVSYTIENSLLPSVEEIFSGFTATTRYDIRRAEKEGIECRFINDIHGFVEFYNAFANERGIAPTSRKRVKEMGDHLKLSFAFLNGQIVSTHSYIVDKKTGIVRFYQSASSRFDDQYDPSMIGRANKLLQYRDMIYFKEQGYKIYDFGGYSENTQNKGLLGINQYKLSFGGKITTCYSSYSFGYFVIMRIAEILELLRR